MICVQSEVTPPLVNAFVSGADDTTAVTAGATLACGLNVPGGVGHFRVLQIIRDSGGAAVAVSEADTTAELSRSEEHTSELQSLMRISYAVFCLKKKKTTQH